MALVDADRGYVQANFLFQIVCSWTSFRLDVRKTATRTCGNGKRLSCVAVHNQPTELPAWKPTVWLSPKRWHGSSPSGDGHVPRLRETAA